MAADQEIVVDARGHRCPVPTLRLRRAAEAAGAGAHIRVLADDPMAKIDIPHLSASKGWTVADSGEDGQTLTFLVIT